MNVELEELRLQQKAVKKTLEALQEREREICSHERDASIINSDDLRIKGAVESDQVNYIMGQSAGFVSGFRSAVSIVVSALASEFRDIHMTEAELDMLVELGGAEERAWLKDNKQKKILEDNGWKQDFKDFASTHVWRKETTETEGEAGE